jgi:hypothetical protein
MSRAALDRPTFETIEAYVLDRMSAGERAAFEERLAGDEALRAEVVLERENIHAVELGGITRLLKEIGAEESKAKGAGGWSGYLKYAAMFAVLATVSVWWLSRPNKAERLFAEHFVPDPGLPVAMGAVVDPAFSDAMVAFKLGHYAEARAKWTPLLQREQRNDTLLYYAASAALADDDADAAIPLFSDVGRTSPFYGKSRWYLFLAYIRSGRVDDARAMDMPGDAVYGDRVRSILAELDH